MSDYISAEYFTIDETKIILSGEFYIPTSDKIQFETDLQELIDKYSI